MSNTVSQKFQTTLGIATLAVALWFLWPQLGTVVLTCLIAYIFYPLYSKIKAKNAVLAAPTTLLASFLVVIVPITFVAISAFSQLNTFAEEADSTQTWQGLASIIQGVAGTVNEVLDPITGQHQSLNDVGVITFLREHLPSVARGTAQFLFGILTSIPQLGVALIVYIYVFLSLLRHGPSMIAKVKQISPLPKQATEQYLQRTGQMAKAMVTGQLMISMIMAAFSAIILIPLGYGHLSFILFVLFTILNFIPLGSGFILVPMVLYSMLTGQFWMGLIVIILYYTFGNLEPIYRTKFIPKDIQLPISVMLLATFCGIAYFGILGVIYGPIIIILLIMSLNLYIDIRNQPKHRPAK